MARNHQTLAFAEAQTSLEIVQAVTILAVWKEPEDDRAAFYFNRVCVFLSCAVGSAVADRLVAGRRYGERIAAGQDTSESRGTIKGRAIVVSRSSTYLVSVLTSLSLAPFDPTLLQALLVHHKHDLCHAIRSVGHHTAR